MDIEQLIGNLDILIDANTKIVKKGTSNSLEKKYFYVTKEMEHYIESFCKNQKKDFLTKIKSKANPSLMFVDAFAGSGVFTLIFIKNILQLCIDNNIAIGQCKIYLNDKMYQSGKETIIDSSTLKKNFLEIKNNLLASSDIKMEEFDLMKLSTKTILDHVNDYKKYDIKFLLANPMITAISTKNQHLLPISFKNERELLKSLSMKKLFIKLLPEFHFFIYLTKQTHLNYKINKFNKVFIYQNNYENYNLSRINKERYELLKDVIPDYENMQNENFWLFTNSQKENYNTIILFLRYAGIEETKDARYIYKMIADARKLRDIKRKLDKIEKSIMNITLEDLSTEYERLKEEL